MAAHASSERELLAQLAKAGYPRPEDLALLAPLSLSDNTQISKLAAAVPTQPALFEVIPHKLSSARHGSRSMLRCLASDDSATVTIVLFNASPWHRKQLQLHKPVRVYGIVESVASQGRLFKSSSLITQPKLLSADQELRATLTPVYPSIRKVPAGPLAELIKRAVKALRGFGDTLPLAMRVKYRCLPLPEALRLLHQPLKQEHELRAQAVLSLKFDEWLAHLIVQRHKHQSGTARRAPQLASSASDIASFAAHLPFKLTAGQRNAMAEIAANLTRPEAMRRILHGDVGCGKTVVAAFAAWLALRAGWTAAIMTPTDILARQHERRLAPLFAKLRLNLLRIASPLTARQRSQILANLQANPATLAIGTHALFQDWVAMPSLALAVIDEQHRFGVRQRQALEAKGGGSHVLMMSATPIPRSLALGMYASVEVSKIPDRPNQGEIKTLLLHQDRFNEVLARLRVGNLQAYWICPLISATQKQQQAAEETYAMLCQQASDLKPDLIHGRLKASAKDAAMRKFEAGTTRLLVATTVVEVGIDAPETDVMVISNAERLGLAQLHQLRGRVGRGNKKGFCALLYDEPNISPIALERLRAIHECADGFEIAMHDLRLRGHGDLAGRRQSGLSRFRFADPGADLEIIIKARSAADQILANDHEGARRHWQLWFGKNSLLATRTAPKDHLGPQSLDRTQ